MKICESCGRTIEPRKKWARNWDDVTYCSERCRKNKRKDLYEDKIVELLLARGYNDNICPSEVLLESEKKKKIRQSWKKCDPQRGFWPQKIESLF